MDVGFLCCASTLMLLMCAATSQVQTEDVEFPHLLGHHLIYKYLMDEMMATYVSALRHRNIVLQQQATARIQMSEEVSKAVRKFNNVIKASHVVHERLNNRLLPYLLQYLPQTDAVGFNAKVGADVDSAVQGSPVVLDTEEYDFGNRFDPVSGVFTCCEDIGYPISMSPPPAQAKDRGPHLFTVSVAPAFTDFGTLAEVEITKNGVPFGGVSSDGESVTNMFLVQLKPNDQVFLQMKVNGSLGGFGHTKMMGFNL